MSHLIDWEKVAKTNPKAPKQTPEQRAKGEELARKMKGISSEELQELRKKAEEEFGL